MGPDEAIARLPEAYAVALRLHAAGVSDAQLAAGFDIEPQSVRPFLKIAEAKLAELAPQTEEQRS
jgi:DNA-directed RNA polymerase specialized sigma24 family protein